MAGLTWNICQAQFYKKFDFEITVNNSLVVNKGEFLSETNCILFGIQLNRQNSKFYDVIFSF